MDAFDHITGLNQYTPKKKKIVDINLYPLFLCLSEKGNWCLHHFDMKSTIRKSSLSLLGILSLALEETTFYLGLLSSSSAGCSKDIPKQPQSHTTLSSSKLTSHRYLIFLHCPQFCWYYLIFTVWLPHYFMHWSAISLSTPLLLSLMFLISPVSYSVD